MLQLLHEFLALSPAVQASVVTMVVLAVVALLRKLPWIGLELAPGVVTPIVATVLGAAGGYASQGTWEGAVMGALAGLAATGVHQIKRQASKVRTDVFDLHNPPP